MKRSRRTRRRPEDKITRRRPIGRPPHRHPTAGETLTPGRDGSSPGSTAACLGVDHQLPRGPPALGSGSTAGCRGLRGCLPRGPPALGSGSTAGCRGLRGCLSQGPPALGSGSTGGGWPAGTGSEAEGLGRMSLRGDVTQKSIHHVAYARPMAAIIGWTY